MNSQTGKEWVDYYRVNPLTNPADTYALIERHVTKIEFSNGIYAVWADTFQPEMHESLAEAVCLAIIEANNHE